MTRAFKLAFDVIASYGFACIIFLFLLLITFLGTLEQVNHGLFDVQRKYFESAFLIHWAWGRIPIPLPGVYLLLVLFLMNLIAGGIIRMRKGKSTFGNLIIHAGMVIMIAGGGVKYYFAQDGHMTLAENKSSNEFESYFLWELAIGKVVDGSIAEEYIIPDEKFASMKPEESRTFTNPDLPFDLTLEGFQRNSEPKIAGPMIAGTVRTAEGFYLEPLPKAKEAESNAAGAYAIVRDKNGGDTRETLLWGFEPYPFTFESAGCQWTVDLRKKRYPLPFTIRLDKFIHEMHPGTQMARLFTSDVTKIENGTDEAVKITMNAPLRHKGYTFFQASWVPPDPATGRPVQSTLAVVRDPADRWPLYSCIVITVGLLIHFCAKLLKYLKRESKRVQTARAV